MPRGITIRENQTELVPTRPVGPGLPAVFGCAPVQQLADPAAAVNVPLKFNSYAEVVAALGASTDYDNYDLIEFADLWFRKAANHPMVAINVFDPEAHFSSVANEVLSFAAGASTATLANSYLIQSGFALSNEGGSAAALTTDYTVDWSTGEVTRIDGQELGNVADAHTAEVSYDFSTPAAVVAADIIGEVDAGTGAATGLELVNEVFPRFGEIPGMLLAPRFGIDPAVAIALAAKGNNINGNFKAICPVDLPDSVAVYTAAGTYKTTNSLTDPQLVPCWPKTKLGDVNYRMSTQFAASAARTIRRYGDVPYKSPSNEPIWATRTVVGAAETEVWLGMNQISNIQDVGVVSAYNFAQMGFRLGGNRTAAYPGVTDPKDAWISVRWMFNWMGNKVVLTSYQFLDAPITRRQIDRVLNSINAWLNSLPKDSHYAGGRLVFLETDNNEVDIMDGKSTFRLYVAPPPPNSEMEFIIQYDPSLISPALFG